MHTTIMTANNIWLDLVSSNPDSRFWEQLREEAARVFKTPDNWTNPASLLELPLADSTIRESIRRNPMITRTMTRTVEVKGGVTLPSGHHVPKGTWMAADTVHLHHDDRFYPKPDEYNPFRFANKHETMLGDASTETLTDKASSYRKNEGLTTASDISLGFGFGKHAWYVHVVEKLLLPNAIHSKALQSGSLPCSLSTEIVARLHHLEL